MNRRKNGFIFISVLALMIIITSVVISTTMINMTYAREVIEENERTQAYYIANSGLEIVYAALNTPQIAGGESVMAKMKAIKKGPDNKFQFGEDTYKLEDKKLEIKVESSTVGYADVSGNLYIEDFKDNKGNSFQRLYYKILSKGMLYKNEEENSPQDICTLTMFVFVDMPNNPKIYTGNKKTPN